MRKNLIPFSFCQRLNKLTALFSLLIFFLPNAFSQKGYNYYKDSSRVGSPNGRAYAYFKKAYYDHIWKWSRAGADSAAYYLTLAIKEDPDYSAAYAFLGHVYQFMTYDGKDWEKKLALQKQNAEKAVSFHPQTGDAYSVMSDVKWHEKDTAQAIALLQKAIAMEPDNVGNMIWISIRFKQMENQNDSALFYLHRIIAIDPQYGQAYMKLGNLYNENLHNPDSAKFYFRKAIDVYNNVQPRDNRMMDAYYWLAEIYKAEQNPDSATYYYQHFLAEIEPSDMYIREPRLQSAYFSLYQCHQQAADVYLKKLLQLNNEVIQRNPTEYETLLGIMDSYTKINVDSVAEKYGLPLVYQLQKAPMNNPLYLTFSIYGEFLFLKNLKRNKEALAVLEKYHRRFPNEPITLLELGRIYALDNKKEQAIQFLQQAHMHLNESLPLDFFQMELKGKDFDSLKNIAAFKKLSGQ
ncbi:MAG: hypothetical protein DI535_14545 [Citrobacter freundii]|nr:MAG: hypothetical protein DI535_14545 [Citrobacter freundii]